MTDAAALPKRVELVLEIDRVRYLSSRLALHALVSTMAAIAPTSIILPIS
jgi:hypothetical protein